jgi:hypothetical protein
LAALWLARFRIPDFFNMGKIAHPARREFRFN